MKQYTPVKIRTADIFPNEYNPNDVTTVKMSSLEKSMLKRGLIYPVVVTKREDGTYKIIDGEHRWLKAKELGIEEIDCNVMEYVDEETDMIRTVNINNLRGEFDVEKLSVIVADLMTRVDVETLAVEMGMTTEEILGLEELYKFKLSDYEKDKVDVEKSKEVELDDSIVIEVKLTKPEYLDVMKALSETGETDDAKAVEFLANLFLNENKNDDTTRTEVADTSNN